MNRYFFDVMAHSHVHYDFKGRDFERPEQAREIAELIALDIECIDLDASAGMEVQVRNVAGDKMFSIQVRDPMVAF